MALGGAKFTMKIDETRLNNALRGRDGEVGKVIAGFGGQVTKDIKEEFKKSAGGAYWPVLSSISIGPKSPTLTVTVKRTKPHSIDAKNVPNLVFFWQREGRVFVGPHVDHPGSQPPAKLVLSGIDAAKRSLQVSTARVVTTAF
jgi:hypothetical protein